MHDPIDALVAPPDEPVRPGWVRRFIVDYNPFFLLSAMSMLGGSLALTNSLSWSPVNLGRILSLAVTINLYELLLVALGLFLIFRRNARRDGSILLILEAFFLVDVAFLNAEMFTISPWVGLFANLIILGLVIAKLSTIFIVLRIPLNSPLIAVLLIELVVLFALPGVLKLEAMLSGGRLQPLAMYLVWWGLFAIGIAMIGSLRTYIAQGRLTWFAPLVALIAGVSLVAHAGTGQWVYDLRYWGADLSPMLALGAFILLPSPVTRPAGFLCAMAAVFASMSHNTTLQLSFFDRTLSPVHFTAWVVYLVLAWTLARSIFLWLCGAGVIAVLFAVFGPSVVTIKLWIEIGYERIAAVADTVRPKTLAHWGVVGVVMSFIFLVIGAVVSLRRDPLPEDSHT